VSSCDASEICSRKGLLIAVSGPSGVGKGTVIERIREVLPNIAHSVSVTSRDKRDYEIDGVSYFFKTDEEFTEMMRNGEILEHDIYLNHYYGTPIKPLLEMVQTGKDVLFDLTVSGSLALKEYCPDAVTIFLLPPSMTELKKRLSKRGTESAAVIKKRLMEASVEIPKADLFDYAIINDEVDLATDRIISIIKAERYRYFRQAGIENKILEE
jgi:guanylate kinase